jgi:hypothetical protein
LKERLVIADVSRAGGHLVIVAIAVLVAALVGFVYLLVQRASSRRTHESPATRRASDRDPDS